MIISFAFGAILGFVFSKLRLLEEEGGRLLLALAVFYLLVCALIEIVTSANLLVAVVLGAANVALFVCGFVSGYAFKLKN